MSWREAIWCGALFVLGLGLLRTAAILERMEPKVSQALDDFHAVREQIPELNETGHKIANSIREFRIFRQQEEAPRGRR